MNENGELPNDQEEQIDEEPDDDAPQSPYSMTTSNPTQRPKTRLTSEILLGLLQDGNIESYKTLAPIFLLETNKDSDGNSFLHRVVMRCFDSDYYKIQGVLEFILQEVPGLTCEQNDAGNTPLMWACQDPKYPDLIVRLAQASPQSTHVKNRCNEIPLLCFLRYMEVGSNTGEITLDKCCEIVELLSKIESNVNIECPRNQNSLSVLLTRENLTNDTYSKITEILLKKGAILQMSCHSHPSSILKHPPLCLIGLLAKYRPSALLTESENNCSIFKYILKHIGYILMDLNYTNIETISESDQLLIILQIIMKDSLPCGIGNMLISEVAVHNYHFRVIQFLIEKTPDFDANFMVDPLLDVPLIARYATSVENITKLLRYGANINLYSASDHYALATAVRYENKDLVMKLLKSGADPLYLMRNHQFKRIASYPYPLMRNKICKRAHYDPLFLNFITNDECLDVLQFVLNSSFLKSHSKLEIIEYYFLLLHAVFDNKDSKDEMNMKKLEMLQRESALLDVPLCKQRMSSTCLVQAGFVTLSNIHKNVDPITYILRRGIYDGQYASVRRFIKIMLKCGFSVANLPEESPTPLTYFLQIMDGKEDLIDTVVLPMVDFLIESGVNINSMALANSYDFRNDKNIMEYCRDIKNELKIPDALFLSIRQHFSEKLVQRFLVHWWGPPAALISVLPGYQSGYYAALLSDFHKNRLLPYLLKHGHLPFGVGLLSKQVWEAMTVWMHEKEFNTKITKNLNFRRPLSLQDLCKYKVRHMLSHKVSYPDGPLMPDLVIQVLPFDLPRSIHNILD